MNDVLCCFNTAVVKGMLGKEDARSVVMVVVAAVKTAAMTARSVVTPVAATGERNVQEGKNVRREGNFNL